MLEFVTHSPFSLSLPSPKSKAAFNFTANKCTRVLFIVKEESYNTFEDISATLIADTKNFTLCEHSLYETTLLQP